MSLPVYPKPFACEIAECWTCMENYVGPNEQQRERQAYIKQIDDREAKDIIQADAAAIAGDWKYLETHIQASGDALLKAWTNASSTRKAELLGKAGRTIGSLPTDAWDGLRKQHNIASEEIVKGGDLMTISVSPTLIQRSKYRVCLLLPYLCSQALVEDDSILLSLLQNRSVFAPATWATLDLQLTYFGRNSGLLEREFNGTCFYVSDLKTGYGAPLPYDSDYFHKPGNLIGFPNAQILFDAQRRLYTFLRAVVEALLKTCKDPGTGDSKWLEQAEAMFSRGTRLFPLNDMGLGQAAGRHVCCPPHADLQSMAAIIILSARRRQQDAERELLFLQTDPEYMQLRLSHLKNKPGYRGFDEDERWQNLALDGWAPVFRRVWIWDYIALWAGVLFEHAKIDAARVLYYILQAATSDDDGYRAMFEDVLVKGDEFSTQLKKLHGKKTERGFTADEKREAAKKVGSPQLSSDPLFWAISNLSNYQFPNHTDGPEKLPLADIVAVAANAILKKNDKQRTALADTQIIRMIDDIAALSCMRSALECARGFQQFADYDAFKVQNEKYKPLLRSNTGGHYASSTLKWKDVFGSAEFLNNSLQTAGKLLRDLDRLEPPQWSDQDLVAQWKQAESLRLQLDNFWEEMNKQRVAFLIANNPDPMDDIDILPDVTILQQGYEDGTDLMLIRKNIVAQQRAQAARPAVEKNTKRPQTVAGTYAPLPDIPAPPRNRAKEIELSKRQVRIKERADREERARIAAGAAPTPTAPAPRPPPLPIPVDSTTLETLAWFWPRVSQAFGSRQRVTWTKCVAALVGAGLTVAGNSGSHYTFTGRDGSMSIVAPHGQHDAHMSARELGWLGRQCTRDLGWTWDTFDPNFDPDRVVDGEAGDDDGGAEGADGERDAGLGHEVEEDEDILMRDEDDDDDEMADG